MSSRTVLESQQSAHAAPAGRTAAGNWKLAAGRALSLRPRQRSVLEIAQGRAWVTVAGGADHVLHAGARLTVEAGQHAVLEPWNPPGAPAHAAAAPLLFRCDPLPPVAVARRAARVDWEDSVAQPLRDLALAGRAVAAASVQVAGAAARLVAGVARLAAGRAGAAPRHGRPPAGAGSCG